jgi:ech hydrogenase subunit C
MLGIKKSPWLIHYDASSCNGCDIETLACLTPVFDVERLGIVNTGNPKHADIFVVTGAVNEQSRTVIRNIYEQMPEPKVVVAVGICASTGGIFRECYNISGGVDSVIPVDVYVPGCAARPEAIIDGVVQALSVLEHKQQAMAAQGNGIDQVHYLHARGSDAPEILALQKIAFKNEGEIYGEENVPAPQQTLAELESDFERMLFLKAMVNGKIIGSARVERRDGTASISCVVVHPWYQNRGIGRRLFEEIEQTFPEAKRFQATTSQKSERTLRQLERLGYRRVNGEALPAGKLVQLQKDRPGIAAISAS